MKIQNFLLLYSIDVNVPVLKILLELNSTVGKITGHETFVNKEPFNKKCFRNIYVLHFTILQGFI